MLNKIAQASLIMTSVLAITACNVDDSFTTENRAPVYSTGGTVTSGNRTNAPIMQSNGMSSSGSMVTTTSAPMMQTSSRPAPVIVTGDRALNTSNGSNVIAVEYRKHKNKVKVTAAPVVQAAPVVVSQPEPMMSSAPDGVIVTHTAPVVVTNG